MDLQQLRFFVHVAELGSFAKAAELLDVPQPTLSRQVRMLELDVRSSLLYRHGRGVSLTAPGARFLAKAKGILHSAEVALAELHEGDSRLRGRIVCGLTPNVGKIMIPSYVRAFASELPLAELTVVNQLSAQLHEYLRASRIDFAILQSPPPSASLVVEQLATQDLYLMGRSQVGPDAATVDLALLAGLSLVMPTGLHVTRQPLELAAARLGIPLTIRFEIDAADSLFDLVNDGFAYTVSTALSVDAQRLTSDIVKQKIVNPGLDTGVFMVHPVLRNMTPLQLAALDLARRIFMSTAGRAA
jgi:LysR family nitrogen assimilation transcriptional regulator